MDTSDYQTIRQLFDDYLRMYASRDDLLTTYFSEDFSGFTGGGDFLVKDKEEWVAITRQDFAQVKDPLRIELKDLAIQSLSDTIAVTTGFFTIHLPIKDHILSRETARLVLIFRKESAGWKISHSSISIPYYLVREGEVYPLMELTERNKKLEEVIAERTIQLSEANERLQQVNEELEKEIAERKKVDLALAQQNNALSILNNFSIELTMLSAEDNLEALIAKRIKEISGATVSIFSEYNPANRTITTKHIEMEPGLLKNVVSLLGKQINEIHSVVSDQMYREITSEIIGMPRNLHEASFGTISQPVGAAIQALLKVDRFIGIAHLTEGKLYGTSLLAMSKGRPDPPKNILESISSLVAVSLRRKRAEEELRELLQMLESVPNSIIVHDAEGTLLYANQSALDMHGYSRDEFMTLNLYRITAHASKKLIEARIQELSDRGEISFEVEHFKKDGTILPLLVNVKRMIWSGKSVLLSIETDITGRKLAEEALRESERKYRNIIENIAEGYFEVDLAGNMKFFNPSLCQILGYQKEEMSGMNNRVFMDAENARKVFRIFNKVYETGISLKDFELETIRKDGSRTYLELSVSLIIGPGEKKTGFRGMARDITERKRAEEALRESEERFRQVYNYMDVGVARISLDFHIESANRAYCQMLGYGEEELVGMTLRDITHPEVVEENLRLQSQLAAGTIDHYRMEKSFIHKTGRVVHGILNACLVRDSSEKPRYFLGSVVDITESKRADEERQNLQERLRRSEKMEALGQMAGGVAHDLNNVLGVLSGYSELLLMEMPEGSRSREHVEKILQSTGKGAAIIQDLLTLARRGVTAAEVVNLNDVVQGFLKTPVFENIKDYHPQVTFRTEMDKGLLNIKGSALHLEKTLMNLVSNAGEAVSGVGEVAIRTGNRYLDKPLRGYDEVKEGDYVILTVSDTGMGIPAENIDKIFEPFYTKKTMGKSGTGLGLAIVWGTVKDHNGYIDVQSAVDEGTTFTLYFPVTREELTAQPQQAPKESYMGKGEAVLVVDDIAEQREIASGLLTRLGYQVNIVSSGEEAVEYLRGNRADILVLDMIMAPGIDGLETYRRVLEVNPKQKAIIASGFSATERVREAQSLGAGAYVKKPYILEKIGVAIREELDRNG